MQLITNYLYNPKQTYFGKLWIIFLAIVIMIAWTYGIQHLYGFLEIPEDVAKAQIYQGSSSPKWNFFYSYIGAPFWEEMCYRVAPILLIRKYCKELTIPLTIAISCWFGWGHNGLVSVYQQGFTGLMLSFVYIKNNFSWKSCMLTHSLWNVSCDYILPLIF